MTFSFSSPSPGTLRLYFREIRMPRVNPHALAVTAADIIEEVAAVWGVATGEILGKRRTPTACRPRFAAMVLVRSEGLSLVEVGRVFKRDHGTVIHAEHRHSGLYQTDQDYRARVDTVRSNLSLRYNTCQTSA